MLMLMLIKVSVELHKYIDFRKRAIPPKSNTKKSFFFYKDM